MKPEAARLKRLLRLERIQALARRSAAEEAARAENGLAQLEALALRTQSILADYRCRPTPDDGYDLQQLGRFVSGLDSITNTTLGDASLARAIADRRQAELALAERRRKAVEDRARDQQRLLDRRDTPAALGPRRAVGTALE